MIKVKLFLSIIFTRHWRIYSYDEILKNSIIAVKKKLKPTPPAGQGSGYNY